MFTMALVTQSPHYQVNTLPAYYGLSDDQSIFKQTATKNDNNRCQSTSYASNTQTNDNEMGSQSSSSQLSSVSSINHVQQGLLQRKSSIAECIHHLGKHIFFDAVHKAWKYEQKQRNHASLQELENQEGELKLALVQFDAEAASKYLSTIEEQQASDNDLELLFLKQLIAQCSRLPEVHKFLNLLRNSTSVLNISTEKIETSLQQMKGDPELFAKMLVERTSPSLIAGNKSSTSSMQDSSDLSTKAPRRALRAEIRKRAQCRPKPQLNRLIMPTNNIKQRKRPTHNVTTKAEVTASDIIQHGAPRLSWNSHSSLEDRLDIVLTTSAPHKLTREQKNESTTHPERETRPDSQIDSLVSTASSVDRPENINTDTLAVDCSQSENQVDNDGDTTICPKSSEEQIDSYQEATPRYHDAHSLSIVSVSFQDDAWGSALKSSKPEMKYNTAPEKVDTIDKELELSIDTSSFDDGDVKSQAIEKGQLNGSVRNNLKDTCSNLRFHENCAVLDQHISTTDRRNSPARNKTQHNSVKELIQLFSRLPNDQAVELQNNENCKGSNKRTLHHSPHCSELYQKVMNPADHKSTSGNHCPNILPDHHPTQQDEKYDNGLKRPTTQKYHEQQIENKPKVVPNHTEHTDDGYGIRDLQHERGSSHMAGQCDPDKKHVRFTKAVIQKESSLERSRSRIDSSRISISDHRSTPSLSEPNMEQKLSQKETDPKKNLRLNQEKVETVPTTIYIRKENNKVFSPRKDLSNGNLIHGPTLRKCQNKKLHGNHLYESIRDVRNTKTNTFKSKLDQNFTSHHQSTSSHCIVQPNNSHLASLSSPLAYQRALCEDSRTVTPIQSLHKHWPQFHYRNSKQNIMPLPSQPSPQKSKSCIKFTKANSTNCYGQNDSIFRIKSGCGLDPQFQSFKAQNKMLITSNGLSLRSRQRKNGQSEMVRLDNYLRRNNSEPVSVQENYIIPTTVRYNRPANTIIL